MELLLVIAIIGALAVVAGPSLQEYINRAKVAVAIEEIRTLQAEIAGFEADNGTLPPSLADIGRANFLDPWNNPYRYLNFETIQGGGASGGKRKDRFLVPLNSEYDLYSVGRDGLSSPPLTASESQDDVVRANDGGFVGLGSHY